MTDLNPSTTFTSFAKLYSRLTFGLEDDALTKGIINLLKQADDKEKQIIVRLLSGWRPKKNLTQDQLRNWTQEYTNLPRWILDASFEVSRDWIETLSLSLPKGNPDPNYTDMAVLIQQIEKLGQLPESELKTWLVHQWGNLGKMEHVVLNRLLTGMLNKSIKRSILAVAISSFLRKPIHHVAHRILSKDVLFEDSFNDAFETNHIFDTLSRPLDFHQIVKQEGIPSADQLKDCIFEKDLQGLRTQLVRREGHTFLWTEDNEVITDRFPEFHDNQIMEDPNFVLDGVIMFLSDDRSEAVELLTKRLTNKTISIKREKAPVVFVAQDILEKDDTNTKDLPLLERKKMLTELVSQLSHEKILISEHDTIQSVGELEKVRQLVQPSGILIKKPGSKYGHKGIPWILIPPQRHSIKALLLYVNRSGGWSSPENVELTFGLWKNRDIVPITKVECRLEEEEQKALFQFVKENTIDRFGPVRSVHATQLFELSFEAVYESKRRKSGLSFKEVQMEKWCKEEDPKMASQLAQVRKLL